MSDYVLRTNPTYGTLFQSMSRLRFRTVYNRLLRAYGQQHWWPGDSPFEIMVGAILTQNTAWSNVEKAIGNLLAKGKLHPRAILSARDDHLAGWLRPSGYFNIKAQRLKAFCRWYLASGEFTALDRLHTDELRTALLGVKGVGPETADDILLYAFNRAVFVIDAYTRRLFGRLGRFDGNEGYDEMRQAFEQALGPDVSLFNEYHALIVRHAKEVCRVRPACGQCLLARDCPAAGRLG